ncbi:MAG: RnfH family protein [Pseudomonadota bacterium]|nr:RnfH family protein [Pseudomonadota bacterium]
MAESRAEGVIRAQVVCAMPDRVFVRELQLPHGATVEAAIAASGLRETSPPIEIASDRLGIFARKAEFDTVLQNGDRVEIYRPLKVDPKEARRRRAKRN